MSGRGCPICDEPLGQARYRDVAIELCPRHGVWLEVAAYRRLLRTNAVGRKRRAPRARPPEPASEELKRRLAEAIVAAEEASGSGLPDRTFGWPPGRENQTLRPEGARRCPDCSVLLTRLARPDHFGDGPTLHIDACAAHGFWFDGDELIQVLQRAARDANRRRRSIDRRLRDLEDKIDPAWGLDDLWDD